MSRFGFVGGSYTLSSPNADCQAAINFYPETDESGFGKSAIIQLPTPGTALFATAPMSGQGRGVFTFGGRTFAVAGTCFYEALSGGTTTQWGTITNDGNPVSWAANSSQLLIASGGVVYCFTFATNVFSTVTALAGIPISQICYTDAFILALQANSQVFYISALADGTSWDLSNASALSVFAENVVAMICDHREPWFFGSKKSQVYYDSGAVNTPYVPINGAIIEQGCVAQWSVAQLDNSVFWLGGNVDRGQGIVWRAVGYTPTRISNHAIEFAIQSYSKISDAIAYTFQMNGHSFYQITFPSANNGLGVTWVYDVATQQWHQRAYFANGKYSAHRSMAHTFNFGMHLVCDPVTGNLDQLSDSIYTDVGVQSIRHARRAPHISTEQQWISHTQLQIDVETGLGPEPPLTGGYSNPTVILLKDPTGILWQVTVNDNGTLQSAPSPNPVYQAQTIYLNDSAYTQTFLLGINASGMLTATLVTFDGTQPVQYSMVSNTGLKMFFLQVLPPNLQTQFNTVVPRGPLLFMRYSDDGGHTWSNERSVECGKAGEFRTRAIFRRLGHARDRVYEVYMTDPVPWRLVDAYLEATPGFSPQERLPKQLGKIA